MQIDLSTPDRERLFGSFGPPLPTKRPGDWRWVDFPNTYAGKGTATGLAVNPSPAKKPKHLVIYFQAGGACWDWLTASARLGNLGVAMHLDGFQKHDWRFSGIAAVHRRLWLFDRADETNPFHDAHYVYIPYCTGDIYAGDAIRKFKGPLPFMRRTLHFRGQHNVRRFLERIVPTFPDVERVYLIGSSAGGYGAMFGWWLANEAWKTTPIDVISDGGHPVLIPRPLYDRWLHTWGATLPTDGPELREGLIEVLGYMERRYLRQGQRYALLGSRKDAIIRSFLMMGSKKHAAQMDHLRETFFEDRERFPGVDNARYFVTDAATHTFFPFGNVRRARIGEMSLKRWLKQMVDHDPQWRSWYERDGVIQRGPLAPPMTQRRGALLAHASIHASGQL